MVRIILRWQCLRIFATKLGNPVVFEPIARRCPILHRSVCNIHHRRFEVYFGTQNEAGVLLSSKLIVIRREESPAAQVLGASKLLYVNAVFRDDGNCTAAINFRNGASNFGTEQEQEEQHRQQEQHNTDR